MKGRKNHQHHLSPLAGCVCEPPLSECCSFSSSSAAAIAAGAKEESKDQDHFLPVANVSRIMKRSLPANGKISKEAKETVQECVSEFISFVTGEASDKCQREKRKTINGDDLLWAMSTLGFDKYVAPLDAFLHKYREDVERSSASGRTSTAQAELLPQCSDEADNHDHHHQLAMADDHDYMISFAAIYADNHGPYYSSSSGRFN